MPFSCLKLDTFDNTVGVMLFISGKTFLVVNELLKAFVNWVAETDETPLYALVIYCKE